MKYINKILLTFFIAFTIIISGKYSVSANVSNSRNLSEYLENTNCNKKQNSSYEIIKLNDYLIPEGEEDEIITINPSSNNYNDIDNVSNKDTYKQTDNITNGGNDYYNKNNETEESSSKKDSTDTTKNNIDSETSTAEPNLETSTSSALLETTTSTSSETLTAKDENKTTTPTSNSLNKNTNNSSSGNSNTSEKSFDRFDLAIANFMVFLLLVAIILHKFFPKLKVLIKSITSDKDEL